MRSRGGRLSFAFMWVLCGACWAAGSAAAAPSFTWSGADTATPTPNWSDPANWVGDVAPADSSTIGTLTFPPLTSTDCTSASPVGTCDQSNNNLSDLTVDQLEIDGTTSYTIGGNGITLDGGLSTTDAPSTLPNPNLNLPVALGADQTWALNSNLELGAALSGDYALGVTINSDWMLTLSGDNEVGPVSITGGQVVLHGNLNSASGNAVMLSNSTLEPVGPRSVGALSSSDSTVGLTLSANGGSLSTTSATLDRGTTLVTTVDGPELTSTGPIDLGGASLALDPSVFDICDRRAVGSVSTLVSTTGALTGTFGGVPQGATVSVGCDEYQINYNTTGTTKTVTATLLGTPTTTVLASAPDPAVTNQTVTLQSITTSAGEPGDLAGSTVAFDNNGTPIPGCGAESVAVTGQLGNRVYSASCQTSFTATSSPEQLSAVLTPPAQSNDEPSTGADQLTVGQDTTTTAVSASSTTPAPGKNVIYTATVTPGHTGPTEPTGSVKFMDGKDSIGACASEPLTAKGTSAVASCTVSYPSTGGHSITAEYLADANFTGSTSPPLSVTVTRTKTSPGTRVVAQFNLNPPRFNGKAVGVVKVIKQGNAYGIAIVAQGLKPNTGHNEYAVWLYNSPRKALLLGFVDPGVKRNGRLSTAGALPPDAKRYRELIIALETKANPHHPGTIALQGRLQL